MKSLKRKRKQENSHLQRIRTDPGENMQTPSEMTELKKNGMTIITGVGNFEHR
jgi:hypothetical protein